LNEITLFLPADDEISGKVGVARVCRAEEEVARPRDRGVFASKREALPYGES
jgi:hypothetical protein